MPGIGHLPLRWINVDPRVKIDKSQPILTVTRNPYDRIISIFYFLKKAQEKPGRFVQTVIKRQKHRMTDFINPVDFINHFHNDPEQYRHRPTDNERTQYALWRSQCFFYPQIHYLNEADGEPMSDRITNAIKFETLASEWVELVNLHGFQELKHVNKSKLRQGRKWQDELTPEAIAKIGELYADDFEHLGYERLG